MQMVPAVQVSYASNEMNLKVLVAGVVLKTPAVVVEVVADLVLSNCR